MDLINNISLLLSAFLFLFIAISYNSKAFRILDEKINLWALRLKNESLKKTLDSFTLLGNAIFHIICSISLSLYFYYFLHKKIEAIAIIFVLIFSWGFNRFLKLIFRRERPEVKHENSPVKKRKSFCFPSGHVMASIPIYFFAAFLLQSQYMFFPWLLIAFLISVIVIIPRIILNHHFFTDVLAGIFMGIFCLNIAMKIYLSSSPVS